MHTHTSPTSVNRFVSVIGVRCIHTIACCCYSEIHMTSCDRDNVEGLLDNPVCGHVDPKSKHDPHRYDLNNVL